MTPRLISAMIVMVLLIGVPVCPADERPEASTGGVIWLRSSQAWPGEVGSPVTLHLLATGRVTVYLNGQRLARNEHTGDEVLVWNVNSLMRKGGNCVALSVTAPQADVKPVFAAWFASPQQPDVVLNGWKSTTSVPPVGWQTTDFNDRDWSPGPKPQAGNTADSTRTRTLKWNPSAGPSRVTGGKLRFRDGDHVLLLGATFIERAQQFGHLECSLNQNPDIKVTFRNLGWSADTVFAESRGIFDSPEKGYERLIEHVRAEEPSVLILCYGQNEAMTATAGTEDVVRFATQLRKLHADLSTTGAEIMFLSPHPFLKTAPPLPTAARWNPVLREFSETVKQTAADLQAPYFDLFSEFLDDMAGMHEKYTVDQMPPTELDVHPELTIGRNSSWSDNGMHWNDAGYRCVAGIVSERLFGTDWSGPQVRIHLGQMSVTAVNGEVRNVNWKASGNQIVQLEFRPSIVSSLPFKVQLLRTSARHAVSIAAADDADGSGQLEMSEVSSEPGSQDQTFISSAIVSYERLRELTVRKNELYFYRWRPQNVTYLFGFRKHEQGNNAAEIAQFDPLIDELEQQSQQAKQPQWQSITVRIAEETQ